MEIQENYSLKAYNTFDIDVKCKYFVRAEAEDELLEFVADYEWEPHEILILGEEVIFCLRGILKVLSFIRI